MLMRNDLVKWYILYYILINYILSSYRSWKKLDSNADVDQNNHIPESNDTTDILGLLEFSFLVLTGMHVSLLTMGWQKWKKCW